MSYTKTYHCLLRKQEAEKERGWYTTLDEAARPCRRFCPLVIVTWYGYLISINQVLRWIMNVLSAPCRYTQLKKENYVILHRQYIQVF